MKSLLFVLSTQGYQLLAAAWSAGVPLSSRPPLLRKSSAKLFLSSSTRSVAKTNKEDTSSHKGIMMILSPAKTLDMKPLPVIESVPDASLFTLPDCHPDQTNKVAQAMKKRSESELGKLLKVSSTLAKKSHQCWKEFQEDISIHPDEETKPCIYTFSGAAYKGLQALECSKDSILYLQENLRIVDGVYGLLRPLDRMQPYRLEMGTRKVFSSSPKESTKLHEFWSSAVTQQLSRELEERPSHAQILLNLASDEYSAAVNPSLLPPNAFYVKVVFREEGRVVAVHAKRARGLMARFLAETNAQSLEDVCEFDREGYKLVETDTSTRTIVFDRPKQTSASATKKTVKRKAKKETKAEPKKGGRKAESS